MVTTQGLLMTGVYAAGKEPGEVPGGAKCKHPSTPRVAALKYILRQSKTKQGQKPKQLC